jgi:Right handed beta helix region
MIGKDLFALSTLTLLAALAFGATPATAQINCGAKLTANTTLTATDPVTTTACPSNGLIISADDITLDCGGLTISGKGPGIGIKIDPTLGGATIKNCTVQGFNKGILLGAAGSNLVTNVISQNNKDVGVEVSSDGNVLEAVLSQNNGGLGLHLTGDGNYATAAVAIGNKKAGFSLAGKDNTFKNNVAVSNKAQGFTGTIRSTLFTNNVAIGNTTDGVALGGGTIALPNEYGGNNAFANGGNGILVTGANPAINVDAGGNAGLGNLGAVQCQIAGSPC